MTIDKAFRALERPSRNGYETTIAMVGWMNYHWALIRYPADPHNKEPTTQPVVFKAIGKRNKLYWSRGACAGHRILGESSGRWILILKGGIYNEQSN